MHPDGFLLEAESNWVDSRRDRMWSKPQALAWEWLAGNWLIGDWLIGELLAGPERHPEQHRRQVQKSSWVRP